MRAALAFNPHYGLPYRNLTAALVLCSFCRILRLTSPTLTTCHRCAADLLRRRAATARVLFPTAGHGKTFATPDYRRFNMVRARLRLTRSFALLPPGWDHDNLMVSLCRAACRCASSPGWNRTGMHTWQRWEPSMVRIVRRAPALGFWQTRLMPDNF